MIRAATVRERRETHRPEKSFSDTGTGAEKPMLMLAAMALYLALCSAPIGADQPSINWHESDAGQTAVLTGGDFTLIATVGEHDAAEMSGGEFSAIGGFWAVLSPACACLADVNADGSLDGLDIQSFVVCMSAQGDSCGCADLDASRALDDSDVVLFVDGLMSDTACD